jgi:hypothetical protein
MLKSLIGLAASPLTKYMAIAILVLLSSLGAAVYLTYDFYGDKKVAEAVSEQLEVAVETEKEQTEKAVESSQLIRKTVAKVREGDKDIDKVSQRLQEQASAPTPSNPTGENKDATESTTSCSDDYLSAADVRLLQHAHCLTDGNTSDCD